jgi:uncharacterized membrane protein
MERMLAVVVDSEAKAHEGARALLNLNEQGVIGLYATRVVVKGADGVTAVFKTYDVLPEGTMGGTAIGTMIGLLGGPAGLAIGAASGLALGAATDLARARVAGDFVADVLKALVPGKAAVVAQMDEESTEPVDTCMDMLGGFVFRRALSDVADFEYEREIAAIRADLGQTKAEHAAGRADRKRRLQARIDALNLKLRDALERRRASRKAIRREAEAKVEHLEAQAQEATADAKAMQADRVAEVRRRYKEWLAQPAARPRDTKETDA